MTAGVRVKAVMWTEYPGTRTDKRFHIRLACGHASWRTKRLNAMVCAQCTAAAKRKGKVK